MAKPLRHSRSDRLRKRIPLSFPLRVGALLRQRQTVSLLLIQKAILAAQALRRCVELETWIAETMQGLEGFPGSSGVCMCGDAMAGHASAWDCGHSPVDSGDYYLSELTKQAAQLLAKPMADAPGDKPYSYLQMQQRINHGEWQLKQSDKVIENLRERLAAELAKLRGQEPVAYVKYKQTGGNVGLSWVAIPTGAFYPNEGDPLFAAPAPAVAAGLPAIGPYRDFIPAPAVAAPSVPEEWREVMTELADDLAIEIDQSYPPERRAYPSEQRRYEGEMAIVNRARALLQSEVRHD